MHLTIISCTPRIKRDSNTARIIEAFEKGVASEKGTADVYYLSEKKDWDKIREAFYQSGRILFALPLYVECVPGIMMEFLESLSPKQYKEGQKKTKIAFLLQSGFAEASQLRCGEAFLEQLPARLNCEYAGTLLKGGMFALRFLEGKGLHKRLAAFEEMGRRFAKKGCFSKEEATEFAKPEYFSKAFIAFFTVINPVEKLLFRRIGKQLGCRESLKAAPYKKYIRTHR